MKKPIHLEMGSGDRVYVYSEETNANSPVNKGVHLLEYPVTSLTILTSSLCYGIKKLKEQQKSAIIINKAFSVESKPKFKVNKMTDPSFRIVM